MPQTARSSGLLDYDFDDTWIEPVRAPRRTTGERRTPARSAPLRDAADARAERRVRETDYAAGEAPERAGARVAAGPPVRRVSGPTRATDTRASDSRASDARTSDSRASDARTSNERAANEPARRPTNAPVDEPPRLDPVSGRRTVTIRGQVAERNLPRRPPRTIRERAGARPDRIAMWAVLLGVLLLLVAATSSHAAVVHVAHVLNAVR
jgi:hypothetical protein